MNMIKDLKQILKPLADYLIEVERAIQKKLKTGIPVLDDSALYLFSSGGKRIRASIIILASGLKGPVPEGIIDLAAAAEIVHAASLIHDDIIDQSFLRRGNITVPQKWGNKVSVLVGDYMYTVALGTAVDDLQQGIFPLLVSATRDMVRGELYQLQYSNIQSVTREHYLKIVEYKTARFMAACAKLGASKAGLSSNEREQLYDFGLNLGYAFQIIDDTLDIAEDSSDTGKDIGNDFRDGKITLPFLIMMEKSRQYQVLLEKYSQAPEKEAWAVIKKHLRNTGAIDDSIDYAENYIKKAQEILKKFPDSEFKDILFDLSSFLIYRKY